MNTDYLIKFISRQLHTFVRRYSPNGEQLSAYCARPDFTDSILADDSVRKKIFPTKSDSPLQMISINHTLLYIIVSADNVHFLVGPLRCSSPIYFKMQLNNVSYSDVWYDTVPVCEYQTIMNMALLLYNLHHESELYDIDVITNNCMDESTEIAIQKHFSAIVFENHEYGSKHNPYDQEMREFGSIRNGDVENLKKSWREDYDGSIGKLAKDEVRQMRNICIVVITLASRAAMEGGVIPEIAYSLSDSYICKIEELSTLASLTYISHQAELQYTEMVAEIKEKQRIGNHIKSKSPWVNKCKDYIFAHLHEKIRVSEIALELDINANYLSEIFHQCEGMTISAYILHEKINLAKNLLVYSHYSYIEIATYLGFSSQSHLGSQFRKLTGTTLRQYRDTYGVNEFE
ncbi:MAG: AraC family transcriptional regulator [Lachnospiraceae bacterium]|nr:AraC family transcriptional regulator [Lachnospiraceae bacterium]